MDDFKVGDIVKPSTPQRRRNFGTGTVVKITKHNRFPILVVFPSDDNLLTVFEFDEDGLVQAKAGRDKENRIVKSAWTYRRMQSEASSI